MRVFCLEAKRGELYEGTNFLSGCVASCGFKIERIKKTECDQNVISRFNACAEILDTARVFQTGWLGVLDKKIPRRH